MTSAASINSVRGHIVLIIGHVTGMLDMVVLPVWVGTLMQHYQYDPQKAGALVTLFLVGAVMASMFFASRYDRLPKRLAVTLGYGLTLVCFVAASQTSTFGWLALFHLVGGLGIGCGLSVTHGTIGRTLNPHRLFSIAQIFVGVFGVIFFVAAPLIIANTGGSSLFLIFATLMLVGTVASALGFPQVRQAQFEQREPAHAATPKVHARITRATWFAIVGVVLIALNQAMMFGFVERIGVEHGFGQDRVNKVLIALGFLNLLPPALAGLLQHRLSPRSIALVGPAVQAALALTIVNATTFEPYAAATAVYVFAMLFTHTFLFGLIARLDPSGRAVAATPAMIMAGAAIGPFLGGTLALAYGFSAIGIAVTVVAALAIACFYQVSEPESAMPATAMP
jgi:predicted MFS family arabinose efflux permease